jgi:hypothetical protein
MKILSSTVVWSGGPSSSIKASLESLVKKGILQRRRDGDYQFSDLFMRHWVLGLARPYRR